LRGCDIFVTLFGRSVATKAHAARAAGLLTPTL